MRTELTPDLRFSDFDQHFFECSKIWLADPELSGLIDAAPCSDEDRLQWFHSLPTRGDYLIWGIWYGARRIGACGLKNITSIDAEYWGYMGEADLWGRGLGGAIVAYCTDQAARLDLESVYLNVLISNVRAIRLYQRMGFSVVSNGDKVRMALSLTSKR